MNLIFDGRLKPVISAVFPMEEAARAKELLANGDVFGKIVLTID